jgi:hypothetical protein
MVAVVLDVFYQIVALRWLYSVQTLIVTTMLALAPCRMVRRNRVRSFFLMRRDG